MSAEGQRFAEVLLARYSELNLHSDDDIAAAGGVSDSTMTKVRAASRGEKGMPEPRNDAFKKYDRSARWHPGSARRLWLGGDPVPLPPTPPERTYVVEAGSPADSFEAEVMASNLPESMKRWILENVPGPEERPAS